MKKIIFMLVLAMSCERVLFGGVGVGNIIRCENDEVICYTKSAADSGIICKFKGDKVDAT